jgi:hypothetical protein
MRNLRTPRDGIEYALMYDALALREDLSVRKGYNTKCLSPKAAEASK